MIKINYVVAILVLMVASLGCRDECLISQYPALEIALYDDSTGLPISCYDVVMKNAAGNPLQTSCYV